MTNSEHVAVLADDQTKGSHTPGPWKAVLQFGQWSVRQDPVNWDGMGYQSIGLVGRFHADRKGTHYGDMFKANARLIAAAPELLEVSKEIAEELEHQGWHTDRGMLLRIREAIAKAEGRS